MSPNSEICIIQLAPELSPYSREWEVSLVECLLRMSSALMSYPIYFLQQSLKWAAISLWGDDTQRNKKIPKVTQLVNK